MKDETKIILTGGAIGLLLYMAFYFFAFLNCYDGNGGLFTGGCSIFKTLAILGMKETALNLSISGGIYIAIGIIANWIIQNKKK